MPVGFRLTGTPIPDSLPHGDKFKGILMRSSLIATAIATAAFITAPGCAQVDADSRYTRLFEACDERPADDEPVVFSTCPGDSAWDVNLVLGEHGAGVAFSDRGLETQWAQSAPRDGVFLSLGPVLEWRIDQADDTPFATILRWSWESWNDAGDGTVPAGQYLVVSALRGEGEVGACHVAYVEARRQPNANQIARDAADLLAPDWQCGVEEPVVFDLESEYDVMTIHAQRRPGH